jgi:hypothetical protein
MTETTEREWPGIPVWHDHQHGALDSPLVPGYETYYCESCRGSHTLAYIGCSALRTGETRRCTAVLFSLRCGHPRVVVPRVPGDAAGVPRMSLQATNETPIWLGVFSYNRDSKRGPRTAINGRGLAEPSGEVRRDSGYNNPCRPRLGAMSSAQAGPQNPNWKGGRTITAHGYVLLKRPAHPAADVRGYVYEHRLVAEASLGRPLRKGEQVHHRNEIRSDNRPENLEVVSGLPEHRVRHRKTDKGLRMPGELNPSVLCGCGCGSMLDRYDSSGRPRRFISGHNMRMRPRG